MCRVARQRVEQCGKFGAGGRIAIAGEAYRRLADTLDDFEGGIAFLLANRIAEDAAKQADVVAEGFVLLEIERAGLHREGFLFRVIGGNCS